MEDRNVKEKLLKYGKEEFLTYGFKNASLRRICTKAGVTTGALYFFFNKKEDLFNSIVEEPLALFEDVFGNAVQREMQDINASSDAEEILIRFIMKYRDEVILILKKSEGTKYADFYEHHKLKLEKIFYSFFEKYAPGKASSELVKLIVGMRIQGYMEVVHSNYTLEKAIKLIKYMSCYADAGFLGLTQKLNEGN